MRRVSWNRVQPTSICHAMELCLSYGREKKNLSVERIADLMGLSGHHTLYKWLGEGRMPATLIRPFEHACGCTFLSRYIAHSALLLTITIPSGKPAGARDINELQRCLTDATAALIDFYANPTGTEDCIAKLMAAMEQLAYHRANVAKHAQPDLDLFATENSGDQT